jgi:hypothetical protein
MAFSFLHRPVFRPTVVISIVALFIPLYPIVPPGLLFSFAYRRLAWKARTLRAYSDLARQPLCYLGAGGKGCTLLNGESYGFVEMAGLPENMEGIPLLLPGPAKTKPASAWHFFGALRPGENLPFEPEDPFVPFGILPGDPQKLARHFLAWAYATEAAAWVLLLSGIGLNILFFLRIVQALL